MTFFLRSLHARAQEIKLASIPYPMYFNNKTSGYNVISASRIKIVVPSSTDMHISAGGEYVKNNSSNLLFKPDSSFILTAKFFFDKPTLFPRSRVLVVRMLFYRTK